MTFNEGVWDRVLRIVLGIGLEYAAWTTWPGTANLITSPGAATLVFLVLGAIALVSGFVGWCPAYAIFGVSTKKRVAG
jgi:hypothetical protein